MVLVQQNTPSPFGGAEADLKVNRNLPVRSSERKGGCWHSLL